MVAGKPPHKRSSGELSEEFVLINVVYETWYISVDWV